MSTLRIIFALALLPAAAARADSPLPPASKNIVCSASSATCVESNPQINTTKVFVRESGRELWSIADWHRWMFLSDDGQSLVVGYDGGNLVPPSSDLNLEVLYFYEEGRLVCKVRVADLYKSRDELRKTTSHLEWVESIRVNNKQQLVLQLVTGKVLALSMRTGQQVPLARNGA